MRQAAPEPRVKQGRRALLELQVQQGRRAIQEQLVIPAQLVLKGFLDRLAPQVQRGRLGHKDLRGYKAFKVQPALRGRQAQPGQRGQQAPLALRVLQVHKVLRGLSGLWDQQVPLAPQVRKGYRASKG